MLDGLEAVEINKNDLERTFRIDSEFFYKKYLQVNHIIKLRESLPITRLLDVSDGNHMAISDEFTEAGIPYYRGQDVSSFFIEQATPIYITQKAFDLPVMKRSHLKKNDILLSIVGTVGKISIVKENNSATCSCKLAILRPKIEHSNYISIFLMSKYGSYQIEQFTRGAVQKGLLLEDMDQLLIPEFSKDLKLVINLQIEKSYQKLEESKQLYKEAEELLLAELGLLDFVPNSDNIAIKSFSDSFSVSGRLDSEYYQPKYDDIEQRIYSKPHTFINKEFSQITTSFDKTKDGYNYIEIGDVNVSDGIHSYNYVVTEELPANAKIKVANGDLIVSTVRPYRGAVSIINTEDTNLVVSGAFTVLRSKLESNYSTQVLPVLLRTQIYKDFMLKYNVGSSYPVIKDENVMNLPIPLLSDKIQKQIEAKIKQSFALKKQSKQLLDLAKRAVEVAIEESEHSAMELINNARY